jgi:hypothetical protein
MKPLLLSVFYFLAIHFSLLHAQRINEHAANSYLLTGNSQKYFSPFVDMFGASLHSSGFSYFEKDSLKKFHVYVGAYATAAFIPHSMKSYQATTAQPVTPEHSLIMPTIFGENNGYNFYDQEGNAYSFPAGFDISQVNLIFPIVHLGPIFNTHISGRYMAATVDGDLKRIELFGIGLNHFISTYWNATNYFVTIGFSFNQYKMGDYLKGQHIMVQTTGGQKIKNFKYYGYLQWNKAPYEFYYENELEGPGVVNIDGENNFRIGAGCGYQFWKININAEASVFKPIVVSLGIGLQF